MRLQDLCADLTQDLFLRLQQKNRWRYYIDAAYTNERIEHELYHIEVPNMVSSLLRDRYPESYRLARRISDLLQNGLDFQPYPCKPSPSPGQNGSGKVGPSRKLILRVYGLKQWPLDKPMKNTQSFSERIKSVSIRLRETRRTGRGSTSQVIISNAELSKLIMEIFEAIDSPADVRTVRSLVLSRLAVEDSRFISIDAGIIAARNTEGETLEVNFADQRATPEELLLQKEMAWEVDEKLTELFARMYDAVKNKPRRYKKLLEIVWQCYVNPVQPSQSQVSRMMGVSASLVTYYRKIFDEVVQGLRLSAEQQVLFTVELCNRLSAMVSEPVEYQAGRVESPTKEQASMVARADKDCSVSAKAMAAVSSSRGRSGYHRTQASS
jgi:hypothetical protein